MNAFRTTPKENDRSDKLGFRFAGALKLAGSTALRGAPMLVLLFALIAAAQMAPAQTETVIYSFCSQPNCADGALPDSNLILDSQGNLYGTTLYGGKYDCVFHPCGTAFKLTPSGTESVLHNFRPGIDAGPEGLIWDAEGNLYGEAAGETGGGVVFEITKRSYRYLYRFPQKDPAQGDYPSGGLIVDPQGNFYGTTMLGGAYDCVGGANNCGTVFKVTPGGSQTVLHNFAGETDGFNPDGGVILDEQGNLYGTTEYGGAGACGDGGGCGVVFKLTPDGTETILHTFGGGTDGQWPGAGLARDAEGNLYGTTLYGGGTGCALNDGCGTVFKVAPDGTEIVLHSFRGGKDGAIPAGGVILDAAGNLYGTTTEGGLGCNGSGCGTVFKLAPSGKETVLYRFSGGTDGAAPSGSLIFDAQGNLYGTALGGTASQDCIWNDGQCGVVFKITP